MSLTMALICDNDWPFKLLFSKLAIGEWLIQGTPDLLKGLLAEAERITALTALTYE